MQRAGGGAIGSVGGDEGGEGDLAGVGEEECDLHSASPLAFLSVPPFYTCNRWEIAPLVKRDLDLPRVHQIHAVLAPTPPPRKTPGKIQETNLSDPPNILPPIPLTKPEVLVQPEPHIIAIESIRRQTQVEQVLLERDGDGGFARRRQAREPEGETLLVAEVGAFGVGEGGGVPGDVSGWEVRW